MRQRFGAGQHPDTHATFWSGHRERPRLPLPGRSLAALYGGAATGLALVVVALLVLRHFLRKRRAV